MHYKSHFCFSFSSGVEGEREMVTMGSVIDRKIKLKQNIHPLMDWYSTTGNLSLIFLFLIPRTMQIHNSQLRFCLFELNHLDLVLFVELSHIDLYFSD